MTNYNNFAGLRYCERDQHPKKPQLEENVCQLDSTNDCKILNLIFFFFLNKTYINVSRVSMNIHIDIHIYMETVYARYKNDNVAALAPLTAGFIDPDSAALFTY